MPEGIIEWTDQSIRGRSNGFKVTKGSTERIFIINKQAFCVWVHYLKDKKKFVRCSKESGACPFCSDGESFLKFATNIVIFETNQDGELIKPFNFRIDTWTFGVDKYTDLRAIAKRYNGLQKIDLFVSCSDNGKDEKYQNLTIMPAPNALINNDKVKAVVVAKIKSEIKNLEKVLPKYPSEEEKVELLRNVSDVEVSTDDLFDTNKKEPENKFNDSSLMLILY